jgi:hypothetical protein
MLISSYLTPTATIVRCRQCWSVTNIRLIEPDLMTPLKDGILLCATNVGSRAPTKLIARTSTTALKQRQHGHDNRPTVAVAVFFLHRWHPFIVYVIADLMLSLRLRHRV